MPCKVGTNDALQSASVPIDGFVTGLLVFRALLQDVSIIAMDEATANVDLGTDGIIQQTLAQFRDSRSSGSKVPTLIIIAHRVNTVMNCDLLLVLDDGRVVEFGSPSELSRQCGYFASMVHAAMKPKVVKGK